MALDLLAIARRLISTDSRSSVTDRPLVDVLMPLCAAAGLQTSLREESRDGVAQFDLLATRPGASDLAPLLLNTHLDTVPPGDPALWTECDGQPYSLTQRNGLLYGLGTADVKLDFVCKLLALERLQGESLDRTVILAGTYGEETGRWGAHLLARNLRPLPAMALVGEPTMLRPCPAHKGYAEIRVTATDTGRQTARTPCWRLRFEGVAAHSSQTHKGRSANDACLAAVAELAIAPDVKVLSVTGGDLVNRVSTQAEALVVASERPAVPATAVESVEAPSGATWSPDLVTLLTAVHDSTAKLRDDLRPHVVEGFDPPWSTVNNGLVGLGDGSLSHVVDVRRLPGQAPEEAIAAHVERLRAAAAACECAAHVATALDSPPFQAAAASHTLAALERALQARGMSTLSELKSGTTEASVYAAHGIDTIVFGPGQASGNIHRPDERVPLADLHAAVDIYAAVIRDLCSR
jgi:acetylornithine deacetylase/succinyl-diaminopimelate desuccinylase-like protein